MYITEKSFLKTYMNGFLSGFNSMFSFWNGCPKFKQRTIDERMQELENKSWLAAGQQLKNACLDAEKQYGIKHD